jgi:leucyl-tRNA synthetase
MITGISQLVYRFKRNDDTIIASLSDTIPFYEIDLSNQDEKARKISEGADLVNWKNVFEYYFNEEAIPDGQNEHFLPIHIPVNYAESSIVNIDGLRKNDNRFKHAVFVTKDGYNKNGVWYALKSGSQEIQPQQFRSTPLPEKMSKSKLNTHNPDDLVAKYGADTFRMYEMFLGPVEVSKPWDTKGIEGVHRFIKKLWRLFYDDSKGLIVTNDAPNAEELKALHKAIKKIEDDTERYSFNTAVSAFMIVVNDLSDLKCHKRAILEQLVILLVPYAPHISEELWHVLGNTSTVLDASYPVFNAAHVTESSKEYPVSINGRVRTNMSFPLDAEQSAVQEAVLANELVQKWMEGKEMKKLIFVKGKMINVVV